MTETQYKYTLYIHMFLDHISFVHRYLANKQRVTKKLNELLYATRFHDSIKQSRWYLNQSLALGEMAIDYGTAYTLFRVLDKMHPNNLLEFGLGQSSKIIHQYSNHYQKEVLTIEHDADWIGFFLTECEDIHMHVRQTDLCITIYKQKPTLTYKNIQSVVKDEKYDFIFVDGPFGNDISDNKPYEYARTQIVDIIKNNLAEDFCIIMHDYESKGVKNTVTDVLNILKDNQIKYCTSITFAAQKNILICSESLHFLATM